MSPIQFVCGKHEKMLRIVIENQKSISENEVTAHIVRCILFYKLFKAIKSGCCVVDDEDGVENFKNIATQSR